MLMRVALKLQTDCQKVWIIRVIYNLISFCICSILPQMYFFICLLSRRDCVEPFRSEKRTNISCRRLSDQLRCNWNYFGCTSATATICRRCAACSVPTRTWRLLIRARGD